MHGSKSQSNCREPVILRDWILATLTGAALCAAVWWTLLTGGGLVGGDTYPYFFPQKQVMADQFAEGRLPLWNDRTGLGYPLHAESQAGIFYPPNQILYRILDVNTAYSVSVVLHYWLAFVLAWRFARCQGLANGAALLAAAVFVYGWFPARCSLEWSIIGGVWFPACLWMTHRLIRRPSRLAVGKLAVCFGMHLLAGHFALAFITQLTCVSYAILKTWLESADPSRRGRLVMSRTGVVAGCIAIGMLLSAVQLVPTLELKRLSQREGTGTVFNPGYGHMPPAYLTQVVASWWYWHSPEIVATRGMMQASWLSINADTNPVEAHLYFGLLPLGLLCLTVNDVLRRRVDRTTRTIWSILGLSAVVYATGWLLPLTRHLPGFSFFMGPGRYTIVTAMAVSIIAGQMLDALLLRSSRSLQMLITGILIGVTMPDLLKSAEAVRDAFPVSTPPIAGLQDSWIAGVFAEDGRGGFMLPSSDDDVRSLRLLAPGPNVANLYAVSCIPQYLGIGPAEYYADEKTYRTQPSAGSPGPFPSADELPRLRERGVTHILATDPIAEPAEGLELLYSAPDTFLNAVWGRGNSPCYLYRFASPPDRVFLQASETPLQWRWNHKSAGELEFEVTVPEAATVGVRELMFPGWEVAVDDQSAVPLQTSGFARLVEVPAGTHTIRWEYRPQSFSVGLAISVLSMVGVGLITFIRKHS